jgi:hypothetical protein
MLKRFWEGWKKFGRVMGDFIGRIVLTIFYFTIFLPFGIAVRWLSDPLHIKSHPQEFWLNRTTRDKTLDDARRLS